MKKVLIWFLIVFLYLISISLAEVSSYKVYAQLSPKEKLISGRVEVKYVNNTAKELSEIYFYLPANLLKEKNPYLHPVIQDSQYVKGFDPAFTEVKNVTDTSGNTLNYSLEDGKILIQNYSLKDNYLKVKLPKKLSPRESFQLVIYFSTKFPQAYFGDMAYCKNAFIWRFGWFPYELFYIGDEWDKGGRLVTSNFYLELLVPKEYKVAVGMDEVREEIEGEWKRVIGTNKSPRRSLPIAISPNYQIYRLADSKDPEIYVYYYPGREYKARILASLGREIYDYYSALYGASEHKRINIIEGQIPGYWGMTADGFVVLGNSVFYSSDLITPFLWERLIEWLVAHEFAHLWWGIGVGTDFDRENWISEGFAQYLSVTYFERKYGSKGGNLFPNLGDDYFLKLLKDYLIGDINLREIEVELPYLYYLKDAWDEEVIKEYWDSCLNGYSDKIYNKSYLALRALAFEIGEEKFDEVIRDIYSNYKFGVVRTEDIERFIENKLSLSYDRFFNAWFYSKGKVDYEIYKVENVYKDGKNLVRVYIRNNGDISMPVDVEVWGVNDAKRVRYDGKGEYVDVELESSFKSAVIDPDSKIPDANRVNNWYPRKTIFTTKIERPLDAYVFYYDTVPSFSLDLSTGEITYISYHTEFYDPTNFHLSLEGFSENGYKGLKFSYLYRFPKDDNLLMQFLWIEPDIFAGRLSYTKNIWKKFDTGLSGNYWDKAYVMNFSLTYNELLNNKIYIDFGIQNLPNYYSKALLSSLDLRVALSSMGFSFYRIQGDFTKYFLIFPQSYLSVEGKVGYINGNPDLKEMLSLYDFKSLTSNYLGKFKLAFFTNWNFPLLRDQELKFFNLFIFRNLDFNAFLEFGGVWDNVSFISKDNLNLGIGIEMKYGFTTLLDIPFSLYVGYAFPIWQGTPNPNELGNFYSYITVGF
ncbi:MAG: M1 family aminopeptidase [Dictyoglomaceae bacterium]